MLFLHTYHILSPEPRIVKLRHVEVHVEAGVKSILRESKPDIVVLGGLYGRAYMDAFRMRSNFRMLLWSETNLFSSKAQSGAAAVFKRYLYTFATFFRILILLFLS